MLLFKFNFSHNNKGFTLIELLVVVAIIGILSTVSVSSLSMARKKARDARRLSDINRIQKALDAFYLEEGGYPGIVDISTGTFLGYATSAEWGTNNINGLNYGRLNDILQGYIDLPKDPTNKKRDVGAGVDKYYFYYYSPWGCNRVNIAEGSSPPHYVARCSGYTFYGNLEMGPDDGIKNVYSCSTGRSDAGSNYYNILKIVCGP